MLRRLLVTAVLAVALVGCSAPSAPQQPSGDSGLNGPQTNRPQRDGESACPHLTADEERDFSLGVQAMLQLRSQAQVDVVRDGYLDYDAGRFAAVLDQLEGLRGAQIVGFGDPGEAIDFYRAANDVAGRIVEGDEPVSDELFASMDLYNGDLSAFLQPQLTIFAALFSACDTP